MKQIMRCAYPLNSCLNKFSQRSDCDWARWRRCSNKLGLHARNDPHCTGCVAGIFNNLKWKPEISIGLDNVVIHVKYVKYVKYVLIFFIGKYKVKIGKIDYWWETTRRREKEARRGSKGKEYVKGIKKTLDSCWCQEAPLRPNILIFC